MSKVIYIPYTGTGKPSKEQGDNNTRFLQKRLKAIGINTKQNKHYAHEQWEGDELVLEVLNPKTKNKLHVNYHINGFVIEEELDTSEEVIEKDLEETKEIINNWYLKTE